METRKKIYLIVPTILLLVVALLLFFKGLSFDFLTYRLESPNMHRAFLIFGAIALPLLSLLASDSVFRNEPLHSKILMIGISSFAISMVFNLHLIYIFSIVFSVCVAVNLYFERKVYRPTIFHLLILIYFVINTLSLLWTNNFVSGTKFIKKDLSMLYVPLLFCMFGLRQEQVKTILVVAGRWFMFFAFLSVCTWILQSRVLGISLLESFSTTKHFLVDSYSPFVLIFSWSNFDHPTYISICLILGLSVLWYYVGKKIVAVWELIFGIAIVLFLSVITQSRFMLLSWSIVNIIFILYYLRRSRKKAIVFICVLVACVSLSVYFNPNSAKSLFLDDVRDMHYSVAFESIGENTLLGTGIGGMTKYINKDNPVYDSIKNMWDGHYHPHNQVIGDFMQTGVLGLLSIATLIIYLLYSSIKQRNILFFSFVLIYILLMSIEMPLMVDQGLYCFVFFISLFTARRYLNKNDLCYCKHRK